MEAPVNKLSILLHCKAKICCKSGVKGWTDIHTYIYISRRIISSKIVAAVLLILSLKELI